MVGKWDKSSLDRQHADKGRLGGRSIRCVKCSTFGRRIIIGMAKKPWLAASRFIDYLTLSSVSFNHQLTANSSAPSPLIDYIKIV
jgi:hypothetical protein